MRRLQRAASAGAGHAAKWLTDAEKALLSRNVANDNAHKVAHVSIRSFIGDRRLWLMAAIYFCVVLGQYGLTFWLPTIIRKSGVADPLWVGVFMRLTLENGHLSF